MWKGLNTLCLSQCRPRNSLLLCLCWKVKVGSCCDMKGLRVSTLPLWSICTKPPQLMTLWGGVRLTAPTFLTFQVWQEMTVSPHTSTLYIHKVRVEPQAMSTQKVKSESDMWKHKIWKVLLWCWPWFASSLTSLLVSYLIQETEQYFKETAKENLSLL